MPYTDAEAFELIKKVLDELPILLPDEPSDAIERQLRILLAGLDEEGLNMKAIILEAMEIIQPITPVRIRLQNLLGELRNPKDGLLLDLPLELPSPVRPGPLMRCPNKRHNYTKYQRVVGQVFTCGICGSQMIEVQRPILTEDSSRNTGKNHVD